MTLAGDALRSTTRFVAYVGTSSSVEVFARDLATADPAAAVHVIEGAQSRTKAEFFETAASCLAFPDYFGRNWDAFWDCFEDLAWQPPHRRWIIVRGADALLEDAAEDDARQLVSQLTEGFAVRPEVPDAELHVVLQVPQASAGKFLRAVRESGAPVTQLA